LKNIATFIALNRFGLGVGPNEAEAVETDPKNWIKLQINRKQEVPAALTGFPDAASTVKNMYEARIESTEKLMGVARQHYPPDNGLRKPVQGRANQSPGSVSQSCRGAGIPKRRKFATDARFVRCRIRDLCAAGQEACLWRLADITIASEFGRL
jgi:uncharacterized protein (DUF1800 family)